MHSLKILELIDSVGRSHESLVVSGIIPAQPLDELYPGCDRLDLEIEDGIE